MTLVPFFLTANLTVACVFALMFTLVAMQETDYAAPRWFAISSACSVLATLLGFWILILPSPRLFVLFSFALVIAVFFTIQIGLQHIYQQKINWPVPAGLFLASVICNMLIYEVPAASLWHAVLYQMPLCFVQILIIRTIYRSGMRHFTDKLLLGLAVLSFIHYFARIFVVGWPNSGMRPGDQIDTVNLAVSLSAGLAIQVALGAVLLLRTVAHMIGEASEQSEIDLLSQIYNRRGFDRHVSRVLARKGERIAYSVIMSELDRFKNINVAYGQESGDQAIAAFGKLLKEQIPDSAVAARTGGEEFVLFLPGTDMEAAQKLAQSLREALAQLRFETSAQGWGLTASFGVAEQVDQQSLYETMRRADTALYKAKNAGRNCVHTA